MIDLIKAGQESERLQTKKEIDKLLGETTAEENNKDALMTAQEANPVNFVLLELKNRLEKKEPEKEEM